MVAVLAIVIRNDVIEILRQFELLVGPGRSVFMEFAAEPPLFRISESPRPKSTWQESGRIPVAREPIVFTPCSFTGTLRNWSYE
jgi:hypothetical protein